LIHQNLAGKPIALSGNPTASHGTPFARAGEPLASHGNANVGFGWRCRSPKPVKSELEQQKGWTVEGDYKIPSDLQ